ASKNKAIDTQTWQTIAARRVANQLTQVVHLALDGTALPEADRSNLIKKPLNEAGLNAKHQELSEEFVELIDNLQNAINDTNTVTSVTTLLQGCKTPIEEIMLHVLKIPEFREKYPEILEAEGLDEIADEEDQDTANDPGLPGDLPGLPGDATGGDGAPGVAPGASGPPANASGPAGGN
ncbi:MAG TPA: hypothetical protein DDW52_00070, partial [Planctomycetaceae bacterium]|nr:hypothetical protein [Planctomycetaceae bacterium]